MYVVGKSIFWCGGGNSMKEANFESYHIRKWYTQIEDSLANETGELADGEPLKKIVIAAAIVNPYAGAYSSSLEKIVGDSACAKCVVFATTSPPDLWKKLRDLLPITLKHDEIFCDSFSDVNSTIFLNRLLLSPPHNPLSEETII